MLIERLMASCADISSCLIVDKASVVVQDGVGYSFCIVRLYLFGGIPAYWADMRGGDKLHKKMQSILLMGYGKFFNVISFEIEKRKNAIISGRSYSIVFHTEINSNDKIMQNIKSFLLQLICN